MVISSFPLTVARTEKFSFDMESIFVLSSWIGRTILLENINASRAKKKAVKIATIVSTLMSVVLVDVNTSDVIMLPMR